MHVVAVITAVRDDGRIAARWDPVKHPRDRHGRFVETGSRVRLLDGTLATVTRTLDNGFVEVHRDDGRDEITTARTLQAARLPLPPVPVRAAEAPVARPVLHTYQRDIIRGLALDRDRNLPDPVTQAAARIRQAQPLTAEQSRALAAHLATTHGGGDIPPPRRRAVSRITARLDAAAAEASGHGTPKPPALVTGAHRITPGDISEGDMIAFQLPDGTLTTGEAHGVRIMHSGRLAEITATSPDGSTATHTVTARAKLWLLPDLPPPDPVPVPPAVPDDPAARDAVSAEQAAREQAAMARAIRKPLTNLLADARKSDLATLAALPSDATTDQVHAAIVARTPEELLRSHPAMLDSLGFAATDDRHPGGSPTRWRHAREAGERLRPLVAEMVGRQRNRLLTAVSNADATTDDPAERAAARARIAEQYRLHPPPLPTGQVSRLLAETATKMRPVTSSGPLPEVPTSDTPGNLADRIAAYRAALPVGEMIGKASITRGTYVTPRLADLEAGKAPAIEWQHGTVPDVAADGGPGEATMRSLDIVMAAGRDLDAELQRTIGDTRQNTTAIEAALEAEYGKLRQASQVYETARAATLDARAHGAGYHDFHHLITARSDAKDAGNAAEGTRLDGVVNSALAAADEATQPHRAAITAHNREVTRLGDQLFASEPTRQRDAALKVLANIRPDGLGGSGARYTAPDGHPLVDDDPLANAMRWAEQHYPANWLERYTAQAPDGYTLKEVPRGSYNHPAREINLSAGAGDAPVDGPGLLGRCAIHEAGHGMEQAIPGLRALEDAYLWSRTSSGPVGERTRDQAEIIGHGTVLPEMAYTDEFPKPYSGRSYTTDFSDGRPMAYELLTTGIESLMAGSQYLDPGFRQWLLGVLALAGLAATLTRLARNDLLRDYRRHRHHQPNWPPGAGRGRW